MLLARAGAVIEQAAPTAGSGAQTSARRLRNHIGRHAGWAKSPGTALMVARRRAILPTLLLRRVDAWAKLRNFSQSSSRCQAILPTLH
jgi:hypothetical protein